MAREKAVTALVVSDPAEREAAFKDAAGDKSALPKLLEDYKSKIDNPAEQKLYDEMSRATNAYVATLDKTLHDAVGADAAKIDELRALAGGEWRERVMTPERLVTKRSRARYCVTSNIAP